MDSPFNLLDYGIAFGTPRRLTDVDCWHLHIPFAFVIITILKPKIFVELGTHKGDSYCAFCQAVEESSLSTACYAVDTWQGDEQAGFYGAEVWEGLRAYHDPLYGGFSRLVKCRFDDALAYFADGSIDLLHIDGHHTYASVKHDFESWLPKMSERGVVLLHDTNVREREFGVWRLWNDISTQYPSFEFKFGNGLGVLAVGGHIEEKVRQFLEYGRAHEIGVSRFFHHLAERIELGRRGDALSKQVDELGTTLLARDQGLKQADEWLRQMETALAARDKGLQQADEWLRLKEAVIGERDRQLSDLQASTDRQVSDLQALQASTVGQVQELHAYLEARNRQLDEIYSSKGWRWLTRYRRLKALIGRAPKKKPKIIHAIANVWLGGSSRLVVDLIEQLGHKYDQEVVTYEIPDPPAYEGFPCHDFSQLSSADVLAAFLREKDANILHVHYWGEDNKPWYEHVFNAADLYHCPVIENINTPVETYFHDRIKQYVYVSEFVRRLFRPIPGNSRVIYPGSNLDLFQRSDHDIPDDVIGMVYRLERDKLNEESIDVFIDVVKERPSTTAYIIGGGTFFNLYQEKVRAAGVLDNFIFTGYVPYESLPDYYRKFSLFVAPVWKESFGQVSTFAMGMGIPVVGYNVGGLPEMLGTQEFFPNDQKQLVSLIIDLLNDRKKRIKIGTSNRKRARRLFSVETMIAKYDRLYKGVLRGRL